MLWMQLQISKKLLGITFNQNLLWNEHIIEISKSCYSVLSALRRIRNFTDFKLRKNIAEMLLLSKIDYNNFILHSIQEHLLRKLQKVQNAAASFVTGKYSSSEDCVKLGLLPIKQRRKWHLLKIVHKAIYNPLWPSVNKLDRYQSQRELRSTDAVQLTIPLEKNTFQDLSAQIFNKLPMWT